jgi:hypothetical protein
MLIGLPLADAGDRMFWQENKSTNCTHVSDLGQLTVAHALDTEPTRYDMWMFPVDSPRRQIALTKNDLELFDWELQGETIVAGPMAGTTLDGRALTARVVEIYGESAVEPAMALRRAASIGMATSMILDNYALAGDIRTPDASCYTYRPEVAFTAKRRVGASRPWNGGPTRIPVPPPTVR